MKRRLFASTLQRFNVLAKSLCQSARGLAHCKTLREFRRCCERALHIIAPQPTSFLEVAPRYADQARIVAVIGQFLAIARKNVKQPPERRIG